MKLLPGFQVQFVGSCKPELLQAFKICLREHSGTCCVYAFVKYSAQLKCTIPLEMKFEFQLKPVFLCGYTFEFPQCTNVDYALHAA